MRTTLLDETEFNRTFVQPMRNVMALEEDVIDIWPYADEISNDDLAGHEPLDGLVEAVYRNGPGTFEHVLLRTRSPNVFMAVVIDVKRRSIVGHHLLNLNEKYGLSEPRD